MDGGAAGTGSDGSVEAREATTRTVYLDELPRIRRADAEFAEAARRRR